MSWKIALEDERYYVNAETMPGAQKAQRLAAAAPELLEALEELFHLIDDAHDGERVFTWDMQRRCRAVIAKAKGEEHE